LGYMRFNFDWPVLGQASYFHCPTESQSDSKGTRRGTVNPPVPSLMAPKINKKRRRIDDNNDTPTWGVQVHWTRLVAS